MTWMPPLRGRLCMLLAGALTVLTALPVQSELLKGKSKMLEKHRAVVSQQLRTNGRARVILQFDERKLASARTGAAAKSKTARAARRAAVSRLHGRAARRLSARSRRSMRPMGSVAAAAVEVELAELNELIAMGDVKSVVPDSLLRPLLDVSGPLVGSDLANRRGATGAGQMIVIADTGVDVTHPAFSDRHVEEACFGTNSDISESLCPNGEEAQFGAGAAQACTGLAECEHGTRVAGIALGADPTFQGIAPEADLFAIQIFSRVTDREACGGANVCALAWTSDLLRALDHVLSIHHEFNISSFNLSAGGEPIALMSRCDARNSVTKGLIDHLKLAGIATVIGAGNNGSSNGLSTPGCISSAIAVGASDGGGRMWSGGNSASWLDLAAPGSGINAPVPGEGWSTSSGTSMAAPHVSGALAALRSVHADATVDEMMSALYLTGVPIVEPMSGHDYRRIDVDLAARALSTSGTPPVHIVLDDFLDQDPGAFGFAQRVGSDYYGGTGSSSALFGLHEFRFAPRIDVAGTYRLYAWWNSPPGASGRTVFTIDHRLGQSDIEANQTEPSYGWADLGDFRFSRNGPAGITVSNANGGVAVADAVRLELLESVAELEIATGVLPPGRVGRRYFYRLRSSGGSRPYNWSAGGKGLPSGLNLNDTRGVLFGTPMAAGSYYVTLSLADGFGESDIRTYRLEIAPHVPPAEPPVSEDDDNDPGGGSGSPGDVSAGDEFIVDNRDPGAEKVGLLGTWSVSMGANPWAADSLYSSALQSKFRWTPNLPGAGEFDVYAWWTHTNARTSNVPFTIKHSGGTSTVHVNQRDRSSAGSWRLLGTYDFASGQSGYVEVSGANGQACADAVRFVKR